MKDTPAMILVYIDDDAVFHTARFEDIIDLAHFLGDHKIRRYNYVIVEGEIIKGAPKDIVAGFEGVIDTDTDAASSIQCISRDEAREFVDLRDAEDEY